MNFSPWCLCVSLWKVNVLSCSLEASLCRRGGSSLPLFVPFILSCWVVEDPGPPPAGLFKGFLFRLLHFHRPGGSVWPPDILRWRCHVPCPWRPSAGCCRPGRRTSYLWRTCCSSKCPGRSPTKVRSQQVNKTRCLNWCIHSHLMTLIIWRIYI